MGSRERAGVCCSAGGFAGSSQLKHFIFSNPLLDVVDEIVSMSYIENRDVVDEII